MVWWNYWEVEEAAMSETNFQPLESNGKVIISRLLLNMKIYNIFLFKYLNVVKFSSQDNNLKYIFVRNNFQNFDLPDCLTC